VTAVIDDMFVFDSVVHVFNFEQKNAFGPAGTMFADHLYAFHATLTPDTQTKLPPEDVLRQWTVSDIRKMVHEESGTGMLVAMPLPLTDLFHDGLSPWETRAELASRDPDRTVFWGSVNPLEGRKALDLMERQVGEFGAKAFKFYNVRYDFGQPYPWRMDDPRIAYPIFEKARDLGVNLIGVHKGVPLGPAADRAHADLGHGRRGGQIPRHQLRHRPCRPAVPGRDLLAVDPPSEPVRLAGRAHQLRGEPAAPGRDGRRRDHGPAGPRPDLRSSWLRCADDHPSRGARPLLRGLHRR
jgi:hypothetical protein